MPTKAEIERERARLKERLVELDQMERIETWAKTEVEKYTDEQRYRLLMTLQAWHKALPPHGQWCNCGECD